LVKNRAESTIGVAKVWIPFNTLSARTRCAAIFDWSAGKMPRKGEVH